MDPALGALGDSPFRACHDPRLFYPSPAHEEALARLSFLVEQKRRLGLLMGTSGSGKSLLFEVFAQSMRRAGRPTAKGSVFGASPVEVLATLGIQLGLNVAIGDGLAQLWRRLCDRLAEFRFQQTPAVVLLDDADCAPENTLGQITRLALHDDSAGRSLTIVLAGREDRMGRIGQRLLELAELRIDLAPWQPQETAEYVKRSLSLAGRDGKLFDEPAIGRLHQLAEGVPRRVSRLADLALVAAEGRDLAQIDAQTIDAVHDELAVLNV